MSQKPIQIQKPEQVYLVRILLIDDDPFILTMLSFWLEEKGYEIKTTENGTDAISELLNFRPHIVITDFRLEDMDGITLLTEIQKYHPAVPVIMLSGNKISEHPGIFKFLAKPVEPDELFHCIHSALEFINVEEG